MKHFHEWIEYLKERFPILELFKNKVAQWKHIKCSGFGEITATGGYFDQIEEWLDSCYDLEGADESLYREALANSPRLQSARNEA